jgi:hypothetical protein
MVPVDVPDDGTQSYPKSQFVPPHVTSTVGDCCIFVLNLPASQLEQAATPHALDILPATQSVQTLKPLPGEKEPAAQVLQVVAVYAALHCSWNPIPERYSSDVKVTFKKDAVDL